ncbi:protocadherin gamma-B7-like [Oryctolagus cuniculus]|uniref:protocadherin gamma-B7-like n=1 Tax=Oryctolagus cuniculus TaxID=9986 RepID=UPI0038792E3C
MGKQSSQYLELITSEAVNRCGPWNHNIYGVGHHHYTHHRQPPFSASVSVTVHISDVNDNAPVFHQAAYVVHVPENNPPGASIAQVSASDPDVGPNGQVSYSIVASDLEPRALSSYVSVSAHSGVVFAQRAFDHEQLPALELTLQARDQGSPALRANVSLRVLVGDRNDNAPRVLYPALGPDGSALFDTVPRAAEPGYLVTKVVAVDADSGHNAWLSYHVLQALATGTLLSAPFGHYVRRRTVTSQHLIVAEALQGSLKNPSLKPKYLLSARCLSFSFFFYSSRLYCLF